MNPRTAAILAGIFAVAGITYTLTGTAEAQETDRVVIKDAGATARSVQFTAEGVDKMAQARDACVVAKKAYQKARKAYYGDGSVTAEALKALAVDKTTICDAEEALRVAISAAAQAVEDMEKEHECTHMQMNCPTVNGGT